MTYMKKQNKINRILYRLLLWEIASWINYIKCKLTINLYKVYVFQNITIYLTYTVLSLNSDFLKAD